MAPGNFAKRIKIIGLAGGSSLTNRLGGPSVPHPSQVQSKIIRAAPTFSAALSSTSGESSIIGRKRKPIGPGQTALGF